MKFSLDSTGANVAEDDSGQMSMPPALGDRVRVLEAFDNQPTGMTGVVEQTALHGPITVRLDSFVVVPHERGSGTTTWTHVQATDWEVAV